MVEMTPEELYDELGARGYNQPKQKKPSKFKSILKGIGGEVSDFHQMMLRKRDEASKRNAKINAMGRKGKKIVKPDLNILHAHERCKIGW